MWKGSALAWPGLLPGSTGTQEEAVPCQAAGAEAELCRQGVCLEPFRRLGQRSPHGPGVHLLHGMGLAEADLDCTLSSSPVLWLPWKRRVKIMPSLLPPLSDTQSYFYPFLSGQPKDFWEGSCPS